MLTSILTALRRGHLDVTLRHGRDHVVRIMETPGLWMTEADLAQLRADLRAVAGKTLHHGALTYGIFAATPTALDRTILTLVRRPDGTPVAFNALAVLTLDTQPEPQEVLHLGLVMVDPDHRSAGLSWVLYGLTCFLLFVRKGGRPVWVSNVTQVPAVVGMVSQMLSDIWPAPQGARRTLTHLRLARRIMGQHRPAFGVGPEAGFDEDRFVITKAYTGGSEALKKTWEEAPKHRDAATNAFCAAALDYDRGDDLLQLGRMDLPAIRRFLTRAVPRQALAGVLVTAGTVAVGRLVLPVLHWFDTTRPFSILRPR